MNMPDNNKPKRPRGRPVEKDMPERIDASPEEIARTVMSVPNKKEWRYLEERRKQIRENNKD